jgi:hypothetical protein
MSKYFRFQRTHGFDLLTLPVWQATHKRTAAYVGEVRGVAAGNFEVRRPSDETFHGTFATKPEAARWLKNMGSSPVVFGDD